MSVPDPSHPKNLLSPSLEALLFVASEPVSPAQLASILETSVADVEKGLAELAEVYRGRGLQLERHAGLVRLTTAPEMAPLVEHAMVESGIILIKYWLEVSPDEQTRRLEGRIGDRRKIWKLSPMDIESYTKWNDYTEARDAMFEATHTAWAPRHVVHSDDKEKARLNLIRHFLSLVPYEEAPREKVKLPKRKAEAQPVPAEHVVLVPEHY